ncbi:MAG TPA: RDD family protein, partial [Mycobacterium sp.]|nr:RDD family protein [Mycobacterium sp.]
MSFGWISLQVLSTAVLVVWFVIGAVSVRLFGFTPGQYALGLIVIPVDNREHVGFGRALARGLLIALVIPPLFTDTDLRGLHDRLTMTAVVRR